ncbi:universal stress protein [Flagellimonas aequoris]|uniref:Universal stress protein n=1 Tax=Flagellimonas aequoris TaxID=2306997 RepID=A0A418N813_9FLAO|nr:universal stress protein [Allomuricauda aequoris]RIV71348.1 universal stress protein [Allomuricauda aequoris]TXK02817.1 universal stress protein [Allomuricauda aequoris]
MMKIVLPTDFSENAFHAISYAARLLENTTTVFYLMHTYTPPVYRVDYALGSPGQMGLPDDFRYAAEAQLDKTRERIKEQFDNPKHTFITHAAFNTLEDEIRLFSMKENVDLIIMGTQGATGATEILFGSNTVHVLKRTQIPVLAIPADYEFEAPEEILFPTDLEVDFDKVDIAFLLEFAKLWHSKIHIMHVALPEGLTEEQENNRAKLEGLLLEHNHAFHNLPDQELIMAINSFQEEITAEILVMVKNKHTFLERLFMEPVIKNVGLHSTIPFLVLPYNLKT